MQAKYLDPGILGSIGSLDVVARQVVEGVRIGMHRSPARGISSEFTAYRQYVPGDEAAAIDWKSYARSDRYYIKLYEAETNFVSNLLIDASGSMTYGSGKISKLEYAKFMAASMAYLITDQAAEWREVEIIEFPGIKPTEGAGPFRQKQIPSN